MPYKDPKKGKEYKKEYRIKNKEYFKIHSREYNIKNREEISSQKKEYYINNKKKILENRSIYYRGNVGKIKEKDKKYRIENKEKIRMKGRMYEKNKREQDIQFRIKTVLRHRLNMALQGDQKIGSAVQDLGCTIPELKIYLEKKFQYGMTWGNYGSYRIKNPKVWNIDHSKALANFDLTDRSQFLEACHYTNLQPMWGVENIKKSNKSLWLNKEVNKEFQ